MQRRNMIALGIFFVFYFFFGVYLTHKQEAFIYQPGPQDFKTCTGFEDAEKVTYRGTRMYVEKRTKGTVVLYHGNAGSACDRDFYAKQFLNAGYGYVVVEYAGYSNDSQKTTHNHMKQDVQNVVSYLEEVGSSTVVVVGESIGSGMASFHTSLMAPKHIVLIAPFSSLADIAARKFWFYPTRLLVDNAFDNSKLLSSYTGSVIIIHGDSDMVISQKSGRKLYEGLRTDNKEFISIEGKGHNDLFTSELPFQVLHAVLEETDVSQQQEVY